MIKHVVRETKTFNGKININQSVKCILIIGWFDSEECANHGGAADGPCAQGDK